MTSILRSHVRFLAIYTIALGLGVLIGLTGRPVEAQSVTCPYNTCDFNCSDNSHAWTIAGIDGVWVIVEAQPNTLACGAGPNCARWYDNADPNWAPLRIVGTWTRSDGQPGTVTSYVDVDDDGDCAYQHTAGDRIWCHEFKKNSALSTLCDDYGGNWDRVGTSSTACLKRIDYGFDFRKELVVDNVTYCFSLASATSQEPDNQGLDGRLKTLADGCGAVLVWHSGETVNSDQCQTTEDPRPGGAKIVRMPLNYYYATPTPRP